MSDDTQTEIERLKRQNEAMREALKNCECAMRRSPPHPSTKIDEWVEVIRRAQSALQPDAGSDLLTREQVSLLVEFLRIVQARMTTENQLDPVFSSAVEAGLERAKTLGLL